MQWDKLIYDSRGLFHKTKITHVAHFLEANLHEQRAEIASHGSFCLSSAAAALSAISAAYLAASSSQNYSSRWVIRGAVATAALSAFSAVTQSYRSKCRSRAQLHKSTALNLKTLNIAARQFAFVDIFDMNTNKKKAQETLTNLLEQNERCHLAAGLIAPRNEFYLQAKTQVHGPQNGRSAQEWTDAWRTIEKAESLKLAKQFFSE